MEIFHGEEQFCFPEQKQSTRGIREILESDIDDKYTLTDKLWSYLQNYAEKHRAKGNGFGLAWIQPRLALEFALKNTTQDADTTINRTESKVKEMSFAASLRF